MPNCIRAELEGHQEELEGAGSQSWRVYALKAGGCRLFLSPSLSFSLPHSLSRTLEGGQEAAIGAAVYGDFGGVGVLLHLRLSSHTPIHFISSYTSILVDIWLRVGILGHLLLSRHPSQRGAQLHSDRARAAPGSAQAFRSKKRPTRQSWRV